MPFAVVAFAVGHIAACHIEASACRHGNVGILPARGLLIDKHNCVNCGAPLEPMDHCSYCLTPYDKEAPPHERQTS